MRTTSILAGSVQNATSAARRALNIPITNPRARPLVSGGEDGLYRLTFATGDVAEVQIVPRAATVVDYVMPCDGDPAVQDPFVTCTYCGAVPGAACAWGGA